MMGVWIALACVLCVGCVPLGVHIRYRDNSGYIQLRIGSFRVASIPSKRTARRGQTKGQKNAFTSHAKAKNQQRNLHDYWPLVRLVLDFLHDFRRKLRVNNLYLKVVFGGGDPADISVQYGYAWAIAGNLMPFIERYFIIKKRDIKLECDYTADKTVVDASLDLTITVARLLSIGIYHGWKILRNYFQITNKVKDGATL